MRPRRAAFTNASRTGWTNSTSARDGADTFEFGRAPGPRKAVHCRPVGQGDKEMDDATVVASPSFDAMLEERGERISEESTAIDGRSYDEQVAAREAAKSHGDAALAATASGASYDARLEAGLPVPDLPTEPTQAWGAQGKADDPAVPKTMVLSPQQWGLPPAPSAPSAPIGQPSQPYSPQPYSPQPHSPQPHSPQPYAPQPYAPTKQPAPQSAAAMAQPKARSKSSVTLFLISAAVTLVVFGTCAAGVIAVLVLRD